MLNFIETKIRYPEEVSASKLMYACRYGKIRSVKKLIKKGFNTYFEAGIALMCASMGGHDEVIKVLLENGANINNRALFFCVA